MLINILFPFIFILVDHFIDALREIADEETKHELQEITNQEDPKNVFNKRQDDSASNQGKLKLLKLRQTLRQTIVKKICR